MKRSSLHRRPRSSPRHSRRSEENFLANGRSSSVQRRSERRSIDDECHDQPRDDRGGRKCDEPSAVRPRHHAPVDGLVVTSAETDADGRTDDTLGSRHRERETSSHDNGQRGAKFHAETTTRRVQRDAVAQVADEVVTVGPEADGYRRTTEDKDPDGHFGVFGGGVGAPDLVDGGQRAHGVRDVVGAVGEGGGRGGHDLQEGVEVLNLEIVALDDGVLLVEVLANEQALQELGLVGATGGLLRDDVDHYAAEESPLEGLPELERLIPLTLDGNDGLHGGNSGCGGRDLGILAIDGAGLLIGDTVGVAAGTVARALQVVASCLGRLSAGCERLLGSMPVIVIYNKNPPFRDRTSSWTSEKERALEDVVLLQLPVLSDKLDVEEGQEEDAREESDATSNAEDGADGRCGSPVIEVERCSTLPDNEHGQNAGS